MIDGSQEISIETVTKIYKKGFSRMPVYDKDRINIIGVLLAKDLMFLSRERLNSL